MDKKASWKKSVNIAFQGINKNFISLRFYTVLLVAIIFLWTQVSGVREYAIKQGIGVSCWYYPFAFSTFICTLFLYFGVVLLFCNAPFIDEQQLFVILRSGKKTWFGGQILYIILSSIAYFTYIWLLSIIMCFPYLGITSGWGDVLWEISRNSSLAKSGGFLINERTLSLFSPLKGCLFVWLLNVLIGCFLGFLIFYINLYKSRTYGSVFALSVIFISNIVSYVGGYTNILVYISPVSWADLYVYSRKQNALSPLYTVCVLVAVNIMLALLIMRRSRKYSIEVMEVL